MEIVLHNRGESRTGLEYGGRFVREWHITY